MNIFINQLTHDSAKSSSCRHSYDLGGREIFTPERTFTEGVGDVIVLGRLVDNGCHCLGTDIWGRPSSRTPPLFNN